MICLLYFSEPEHPLDNLHDLVRVDGAAAVCVKGCEDPVELLLDRRHVLHVGGLEPLEEVEGAAVVLIKHPEQRVVEDIILTIMIISCLCLCPLTYFC